MSPSSGRTDVTTAWVVIGGDLVDQAVPHDLPAGVAIVAADSGLDLAERLGLRPIVVVGDLDSVTAGALRRATGSGVEIVRAPAEKDETDFELALDWARATGAREVLVLGGAAGRLDHLVANLAVLTGPLTAGLAVSAWLGTTRVDVVRERVELSGAVGALVSLSAWHGPAIGVTTSGLRYPLDGETLHAGSARGTSNEFIGDLATVELTSGVLVAIAPEAWRTTDVRVVAATDRPTGGPT